MWPYGGLFEINSDLGGFTLEVSLQDPQLSFFSESASEGFWLPTLVAEPLLQAPVEFEPNHCASR